MLNVHPVYGHKSLSLILKVDEFWSFVQANKHPRWLWWVEETVSGQVSGGLCLWASHSPHIPPVALLESAQIAINKWITETWWAYSDCLDQRLRVKSKALLQSL